MTPKERWRSVLAGRTPDRTPCDYWATAEVTRRLLRELECGSEPELWRRLGIDKCVSLAPRHPRAREDTWHIPSLFSVWGIETALIPYMDGLGAYEEAINPPLAAATTAGEIEGIPGRTPPIGTRARYAASACALPITRSWAPPTSRSTCIAGCGAWSRLWKTWSPTPPSPRP